MRRSYHKPAPVTLTVEKQARDVATLKEMAQTCLFLAVDARGFGMSYCAGPFCKDPPVVDVFRQAEYALEDVFEILQTAASLVSSMETVDGGEPL